MKKAQCSKKSHRVESKSQVSKSAIHRLLAGFNLEQYAAPLCTRGFGENLELIGVMEYEKKMALIDSLGVLPGHKMKLFSVFESISDLMSVQRELDIYKKSTSEKTPPYRKARIMSVREEKKSHNELVSEKPQKETMNLKYFLGSDSSVSRDESLLDGFRSYIDGSLKESSPDSKPQPVREEEKEEKINLNIGGGKSFDSATLTVAIGLLDLKWLCHSFSFAILQHIHKALKLEDSKSKQQKSAIVPEGRPEAGLLTRQVSNDLARDCELIDLDSIDITKSYKPSPSLGIKAVSVPNFPSHCESEAVSEFSKFDMNFDFSKESYFSISNIPEEFLVVPPLEEIISFCNKIMVYAKMEREIPIIALIYIEKLMTITHYPMTPLNWRRFMFIALVIASKVWDDQTFENKHFIKVFPDLSLREINELERIFLNFLDYKLNINGSEYAKYYFILRAISSKSGASFPLRPMPLHKVMQLQSNARKVQENLKLDHANFYKTG